MFFRLDNMDQMKFCLEFLGQAQSIFKGQAGLRRKVAPHQDSTHGNPEKVWKRGMILLGMEHQKRTGNGFYQTICDRAD